MSLPFHSSINQTDYQLHVALPYAYAKSDKTYPVVYLLDANADFPLVTAISRRLQREDDLKEYILVGISYKEFAWENRQADYTPTKENSRPKTGEAKKFKNVLKTEIFPLIEEKLRTDKTSKTLLGHSLGGLFGTVLLMADEGLFHNYIISSPSIWWDNSIVLKSQENKNFKTSASVFLTVGADENPHMIEGWKSLSSFISDNMPNTAKKAIQLDGENHASAKFRAYADGLRWLFK